MENAILEKGIDYRGLIQKNEIDKNCFKFQNIKNSKWILFHYDKYLYGHKVITEENDNFNLKCITFYDKNENLIDINTIFYKIQFIINLTEDGQGMKINNLRAIYEGDIFSLNQIGPENNYNYLSFFIFYQVKIKLLSYICDTYPLCLINSDIIHKSKQIKKIFYSYSYSFTREEIGKIISPIIKRQHFFIICE